MSLQRAIENSWLKPNLLTVLLWPLSLIYGALFALRSKLYAHGFLKSHRAPLPVIVVGNLTVGGTGKTPLVIFLVEELRRQGFTPGVISRGYGGQATQYPCVVERETLPEHSGDEPALIVRRTGVPMVVGADRAASINTLLDLGLGVDIIVSDDGLQHLALQRDIEICLLDATSPQTNTCLLPAGPYRERKSRLAAVDLVVEHGLAGDSNAAFAMRLSPREPKLVAPERAISKEAPSVFDAEQEFHAVAGIGNPTRFFNTCRDLGYRFKAHPFADHHEFSSADINFDGEPVLMTEKDAVKCRYLADSQHWYLPVDATLSEDFVATLKQLLANKGVTA